MRFQSCLLILDSYHLLLFSLKPHSTKQMTANILRASGDMHHFPITQEDRGFVTENNSYSKVLIILSTKEVTIADILQDRTRGENRFTNSTLTWKERLCPW
ncbi:hypothetical protein BsWGS_07929 [Bradybaena similaris]